MRRTAAPEERRQQLIDATIRCVAEPRPGRNHHCHGRQGSGAVSQGIINLHFQSKDRLLTETLRFIADEYRNACREQRPSRPSNLPRRASQVMVEVCFRRNICSREKLAVVVRLLGRAQIPPDVSTHLRGARQVIR